MYSRMSKNHIVAMSVQVILLTIKPVDLHLRNIIGATRGFLVLFNLNHTQMVEAAANQALHTLCF